MERKIELVLELLDNLSGDDMYDVYREYSETHCESISYYRMEDFDMFFSGADPLDVLKAVPVNFDPYDGYFEVVGDRVVESIESCMIEGYLIDFYDEIASAVVKYDQAFGCDVLLELLVSDEYKAAA